MQTNKNSVPRAAVICEYNPFHNGHLRQLELIRARLGEECVITAVMSGNFVQRGELASAPKYERAAAAVKCGCDLVLELPFPWSCASAEFFAGAGVSLVNAPGVFDILAFGCESLPPDMPFSMCNTVYTPAESAVIARFHEYLARRGSAAPAGQPQRSEFGSKLRVTEAAYHEKYGSEAFYPTSPNDILAAEYIAALNKCNSHVVPLPLPRIRGLSATASRAAWKNAGKPAGDLSMREIQALQALIPPATLEMCRSRGAPVSLERLGIALPMFFRLAEPAELAKCCDADGGLAERLVASARESASPGELLKRASAKHLTSARIRRAAIFALLGTTYAELEEEPPYTLVLAANTRGSALLRELKKRSAVPVITKPADYRLHNAAVTTAFERSLRADGVYQLASGCGDSLKMTPYIK